MKHIMRRLTREWPIHAMLIPAIVLVCVFSYYPLYGLRLAFQKYNPLLGFLRSSWIGLDNFRFIINLPGTFQVIWNTVNIAIMKIIGGIIVPVTFALLLNEITRNKIKRAFQTFVYIPNFISWIVLSGIFLP